MFDFGGPSGLAFSQIPDESRGLIIGGNQMKYTRIVALLSALVLILAACGGGDDDDSSDTTEGATETTEAPTETTEGSTDTTEDMGDMDFEGLALDAGGCDYGGTIQSITAVDANTVDFQLCKSDPAFLAKLAFSVFGIQPAEHLEETGGAPLDNPIGTGPYAVSEWVRGDSVNYTAHADYYGQVPAQEQLVLKWATEGAQRLLELQSGNADLITFPSQDDWETIEGDDALTLLPKDESNILYVGFTNTFAPFDNADVRKAVAMGIDRQRIVDNFYPAGSEVASHFTPCSILGGCEGDSWYDFDAEAAKTMLADAGYPDGFDTTIYYRDVFRGYLPEPGLVAVEIQTQLAENLGINADVVVMESGQFIDESTSGLLDGIHLLGWTGDYPHPTNFLDFHFNADNPQFGDAHPEIYEPLKEAAGIADEDAVLALYEEANNAIKELVPMVPIVHSKAAFAVGADLGGAYAPPWGQVMGNLLDNGGDTLVIVQNAEPISLYCSDESDGESLRACAQSVEGLYSYGTDGSVQPQLATECVPNEDVSQWTCSLRDDAVFHNGDVMDANDVVASFSAGLDASNPLHVGNTGSFDYYAYLWGGLINAPEDEG